MGLLKRKKKKEEIIDLTPKPKSTFTYSEKYYGSYPLDPKIFTTDETVYMKIEMVPGGEPLVDTGFLGHYCGGIYGGWVCNFPVMTETQFLWIYNRISEFKQQVQLHREQHADVLA